MQYAICNIHGRTWASDNMLLFDDCFILFSYRHLQHLDVADDNFIFTTFYKVVISFTFLSTIAGFEAFSFLPFSIHARMWLPRIKPKIKHWSTKQQTSNVLCCSLLIGTPRICTHLALAKALKKENPHRLRRQANQKKQKRQLAHRQKKTLQRRRRRRNQPRRKKNKLVRQSRIVKVKVSRTRTRTRTVAQRNIAYAMMLVMALWLHAMAPAARGRRIQIGTILRALVCERLRLENGLNTHFDLCSLILLS